MVIRYGIIRELLSSLTYFKSNWRYYAFCVYGKTDSLLLRMRALVDNKTTAIHHFELVRDIFQVSFRVLNVYSVTNVNFEVVFSSCEYFCAPQTM